MNALVQGYYTIHDAIFSRLQMLDGLAPLALRLYLGYVFWMAGSRKIAGMDSTIAWFGNPDWGLGLPFPSLLAHMAAYTEAVGALLLLVGLATRWISIPLMVTMLVAIFTVHWDADKCWSASAEFSACWPAIAESGTQEVGVRLGAPRDMLQEHGNYAWLTEKGNFVILNNGIEFGVTYLLMLFSLMFTGGGRYFSLDYYMAKVYPLR